MNTSLQGESRTVNTSLLIKFHRAFSIVGCLMYVLARSDFGGLPPTLQELLNNSLIHGSLFWTMFAAAVVGVWFGRRYSSQQSDKKFGLVFSGETYRLANFKPYLLFLAFIAVFELVVIIFRIAG